MEGLKGSSGNPDELIRLERQYGAHNYDPLPVVIARGRGPWVWDVSGKKYLDCLSAYSALNQGHLHPHIVEAARKQLERLTLTSRAFYNDRLGPFLKRLCQFAGMEVALPMNTGAEAVETGIKIARRWAYFKKNVQCDKAEIIVCKNNFHGRTTTIVGFSTDPESSRGFGPGTPGFKIIPFNDPQALEDAIGPNTAAFLVEPIQGEAGVIIPDEGYLKKVKRICSENNVLLMLDEIQTGFGRTGRNFAFQHEEVVPDILLVGKALGGGILPISAVLTRWDIMEVITPHSHGSTFGGNPLAAAVGIAALDVIEDEGLAERAEKLGAFFLDALRSIAEKYEGIREVRGKGLLIALEFDKDAGSARKFAEILLEKGVLAKDTHGHTIRFAPPLVISREDLEFALERIDAALSVFLPTKK